MKNTQLENVHSVLTLSRQITPENCNVELEGVFKIAPYTPIKITKLGHKWEKRGGTEGAPNMVESCPLLILVSSNK